MDDAQRFMELKKNIGSLSDQKIRLEERYKSEREQLEKLVSDISSKGYDPKKLSEIRKEKEKMLKEMLEDLENEVKKETDIIDSLLNLIKGS